MAVSISESRVVRVGGGLEIKLSDGRQVTLSLKDLRDGVDLMRSTGDPPEARLTGCETERSGGSVKLSHGDGFEQALAAARIMDLGGLVGPHELPADLVVSGADWLITCHPSLGVGGESADEAKSSEAALGIVLDGGLAARAGRIIAVGAADRIRSEVETTAHTVHLDASSMGVAPGLVDPHTHPVFGGQRAREFALRAAGATYQEIAAAGGGIRSTMASTREASEAELKASTRRRLRDLLGWGVTTIEGKSGYSLNLDGELRMLRIIRDVRDFLPIDISPTLLAAHVLPPEYKQDRQGYVDLVINEIIPAAVEEGLAESCDVFCEQGAFTTHETRRILESARKHGLGLRVHAEQFTDTGGAALAAELGALSADHLEAIGEEAVAAMAEAGTVAVLLPGAALMVGDVFPDGRRLIDAGVKVAIGTDLNPGTSMTESLPLMMSLACTRSGMTPAEAWLGVTIHGAKAVGRDDVGKLEVGCRADFIMLDAPEYASIPYHLAHNYVRSVYKSGRCALRA
jgi:imidazolonepropionase